MGLYGTGPPLVKAATWLTHIEADATSPFNRHWIEELARSHTYVTYDARGCGLSARRVDDISFDAWVRDLETVVDALGLPTFPLLGISQGAAIAVAYAARHPERVSRLVLFGGFATSYFTTGKPDPRIREEAETLLKVAELGWGGASPEFRQVFVNKFMPHASSEAKNAFDDYQHLTADAQTAVRCLRAMFSINVKGDATRVRCPALVFHMRGDRLIYFEQGRSLAALVPGARFLPVEGDNHLPLFGDPGWPTVKAALHEFLGSAAVETARLTERQREVLQLVAAGRTDKEIARVLQLSPRTVEMHVAGALKALACGTRAEAVHRATGAGLLAR
ncbi:alpha/beta fold hydrolase [Ramlibacter montanisoli]|uniref:Alpha/beta fold hydrolase n=1 Tax=Ramlibacter montanisoli TaxID=2732512 RepID=A0A849KMZ6_9BURK|nr:alpha/beta fold hydrolase [Ramlibacter montanisoli]NNU45243.1 alpha/beta fold hydrolase [Ramlibacter montanisoli]